MMPLLFVVGRLITITITASASRSGTRSRLCFQAIGARAYNKCPQN
jgi:hypothetical protein